MCFCDNETVVYVHSEDEDPEYKPLRMPFKDDLDDFTNSPLDDKEYTIEGEPEGKLFTPLNLSTVTILYALPPLPCFLIPYS